MSSNEVEKRILAAARREFAAHGLRGTSVRSIGARAGVTAAMINYYFRSKAALYDKVVEEAMGGLLERVSQVLVQGQGDHPAHLVGVYFDFLVEERDFQRLVIREVLDGGEVIPSYVQKHLVPLRKMFEARFGYDEPTFQAALSMFGAVAGYFLYEPILKQLFEMDPLAQDRLALRRQHIQELASLLSGASNEDA